MVLTTLSWNKYRITYYIRDIIYFNKFILLRPVCFTIGLVTPVDIHRQDRK